MNDFIYQMMLSLTILLASDISITGQSIIKGLSLYAMIGLLLKVTAHPIPMSPFMIIVQLIIVVVMTGKVNKQIIKGYLVTVFLQIIVTLIMMLAGLDFQLLESLITIILLLIGKQLHVLSMDSPLPIIGMILLSLFFVSLMNTLSVMSVNDLILHLLVAGFVFVLFAALYMKQRQLQESLVHEQVHQNYIQTLLDQTTNLRMYKHDSQARLLAIEDYLKRKDNQGLEHFIRVNTEKLKDLKPLSEHQEIDTIMQYFHQKYPQVILEVQDDVLGIITMDHEQFFSLLYNLMLNAYESSLQTDDPYVSCRFSSHHKTFNLLIQNRVPDFFDLNALQKQQTTKIEGHHGYGLKTIHQIMKQYDGLSSYEMKEDTLINKIVLFECIDNKM